MPTVQVRDLHMHFEAHGRPDAEPLLLLHGFTSTGKAFAPYLDPLGKRYRLIIPDWRGHGRTPNASGRIVHAELARDMAAFAEALGIDRAHFCGFSSGGMQLLFLAIEHPRLVQSLTLVGATYTFDDHVKGKVHEVMASVTPERIQALEAVHGETHGAGYGRTILDLWAESVLRPQELPFTPDDLGKIACSTLIVHGDRDLFFPVRVPVTMYQAIPNSELCILPRCGHGLPRESIPLFVAALLDFLGRNRLVAPV